MAVGDEQRLITPISQRQFELYALSLERGPNFDPAQIFGSYQAGHGSASGCILLDPERGTFTALALRRRVDHRWVRVDEGGPYPTPEAALDQLTISMRAGEPPEPLPPGARRRPLLLKTGSRGTSPEFDLLTSTISHFPALMAVGECYPRASQSGCQFRPRSADQQFRVPPLRTLSSCLLPRARPDRPAEACLTGLPDRERWRRLLDRSRDREFRDAPLRRDRGLGACSGRSK